jgi:anti-sigma B factor antagonist
MSEPHVARLQGEIDLANAAEVEAEVLQAMGDAATLVVDLTAVTYFDSSGMRMLDGIAGACDAAGVTLRVVAPEGSPARLILRIVAWPEDLIAESVEAAR